MTYIDIIPSCDNVSITDLQEISRLNFRHTIRFIDIFQSNSKHYKLNSHSDLKIFKTAVGKIKSMKLRSYIDFCSYAEVTSDTRSSQSMFFVTGSSFSRHSDYYQGNQIPQKVYTINSLLYNKDDSFICFLPTVFRPLNICNQSPFYNKVTINKEVFPGECFLDINTTVSNKSHPEIEEYFDKYLSGKKILSFLNKLPEFKINLTLQQQRLVSDIDDC